MLEKLKAVRDKFYEYLMLKYECYDQDTLMHLIDDEDNEIRERLETLVIMEDRKGRA